MTKRARIDPDVFKAASRLRRSPAWPAVTTPMAAVARHDVPGQFTPDVAMLDLAVTALDRDCPPDAEPLEYEGLRER